MQVLSRWKIFVILEAPIAQSFRTATTGNLLTTHCASLHSTYACFEKWKHKFNGDVGSNQQPSKDYIRYAVRQKRADTKKALKNILFNGGCSTSKPELSSVKVESILCRAQQLFLLPIVPINGQLFIFSPDFLALKEFGLILFVEKPFLKIEADYGDQLNKKSRIKPARQARRAFHKKMKRKYPREKFCDDFDEYPERIFQATFGKRCFEWTFKPWEMEFDWRKTSDWSKSSYQEHGGKSEIESDGESFIVGSYADRRILGLPTTGALKIEDVKSAFHRSALKWHPDKHQGPSQADAEEKFKTCANAYKSLCNALATA